jgi:hypothetical protein
VIRKVFQNDFRPISDPFGVFTGLCPFPGEEGEFNVPAIKLKNTKSIHLSCNQKAQ